MSECIRFYSLHVSSSKQLGIDSCFSHSTTPDIRFIYVDDPGALQDLELLNWKSLKEQGGAGWFWRLTRADCEGTTKLRLETRRSAETCVVFFGHRAEEITVFPKGMDMESQAARVDLSGWLLGSVLGLAMCLRGYPVLHGSVVAIGGQAVAFLGVSGAGKSTLAAAFVAAGHGMMADDHLVVEHDASHGYLALSGPSRLRLWSSSLGIVNAADTLPTGYAADGDGKFFVPPAHGQYQQNPLPLAAIYILMPRDPMRKKVDIEGLGPAGGLNALMNQRFCNAPITPTYPAETFAALSDLAQQVPVRHVYRPHGLETLPELVTAVLADIGHYDV